MKTDKNASGLLAALLIVSAALFAVGVALEKSAESNEPGEASHSEVATHSESEESHSDEGGAIEDDHSEAKETVLGVDIEQPLFVAAAVIVSLVLAALALRSTNRLVLVVIGVFALAFALLDGKELFHQLDESRTGLAVLAGVIALLHLGAAGIATREARA